MSRDCKHWMLRWSGVAVDGQQRIWHKYVRMRMRMRRPVVNESHPPVRGPARDSMGEPGPRHYEMRWFEFSNKKERLSRLPSPHHHHWFREIRLPALILSLVPAVLAWADGLLRETADNNVRTVVLYSVLDDSNPVSDSFITSLGR